MLTVKAGYSISGHPLHVSLCLMTFSPSGQVIFIEFKQLGKKPTVMQEREHARMRNNCATVYVVDSLDMGKGIIDALS